MDKSNLIITIGRQTGSGGSVVGEKLAKRLNIPYYDRELLARAAKDSGMSEKLFERHDEQPTRSLLYSLATSSFSVGFPQNYSDMPLDHKIFLAQFDAIRKIAEEGPCVIVGRCADYALEERGDLLTVFILASRDDRIKRIMEKNKLTEEKAQSFIRKNDKNRANYYDYYSSKRWGSAESYDLCLNSSVFGVDGCVDLILDAMEKMQ